MFFIDLLTSPEYNQSIESNRRISLIPYLRQRVIQLDQRVVGEYARSIAQGQYTRLQSFCRWIGAPVQMTAAYLLIGWYAYSIAGWRLFGLHVLAIVLTNVVNLGIKAMFKRVRPSAAIFESPLPYDEYAFPSGHAATTMAIAVSLGLAVGGGTWALLAWALMMGVSRFFAELHHPTDILAGFGVGMICGFLIQAGYFLLW